MIRVAIPFFHFARYISTMGRGVLQQTEGNNNSMIDTKTLLLDFKVMTPVRKIVHERQAIVQDVCDFMNDQRWTYWNGRTKRLSPSAIRDLLRQAGIGKNPQSLFNWLLKKTLEKLRKVESSSRII